MKYLINQIYSLFQKYPTRLTSHTDLQSLITRLRPVNTEHDLIRIGAADDGGYLIPDDLKGIEACFSPGVDCTSDFELDCAQRGMEIFMADYSVDGPAINHERFHFIKKFLGITNAENIVTLEDWVRSSFENPETDLILQMDIEGAEYEVLLGASEELLQRFRIIVIEFHSLKNLWSKPFFSLASKAFEKLLQTHVCVHNHPNNANTFKKIGNIEIPSVTEMTFLRKDRFSTASFATEFPHPLDTDNTGKRATVLPECWYKSEI